MDEDTVRSFADQITNILKQNSHEHQGKDSKLASKSEKIIFLQNNKVDQTSNQVTNLLNINKKVYD
jgi:hypothetical protein